ncbi:MAG: toxin-antitoxin system HicB family antitoxin [Gammaproteobacteria bacterium]|nr:toxin-antitoxin system HicB family antitoxin [Gammaproteobacteria bacterium]
MSTLLQVRNIPEELHRRLKARAALEGLSMAQFVIREIERALQRPTRQMVLEAIERQPATMLDEAPAEAVRQERDSR